MVDNCRQRAYASFWQLERSLEGVRPCGEVPRGWMAGRSLTLKLAVQRLWEAVLTEPRLRFVHALMFPQVFDQDL